MKKIITIIICVTIFLKLSSQINTTIIEYTTWTGASGCNIFSSLTNVPATLNGNPIFIKHKSRIGQPEYNGSKSVILSCAVENTTIRYSPTSVQKVG